MNSLRLFIARKFIVRAFIVTFIALSLGAAGWADDTPSTAEGCNVAVASVPSRPTVTSATDTTQCGVVEMEYGLERQWTGAGANRDDFTGGFRFGVTPKLDVHWSSSDFLHVMDGTGDRTGFGDTWVGFRYRFSNQTRHRPAFGMLYSAKLGSASLGLGGTDRVDHEFAFLASKDVRRVHFDFNVLPLVAGREGASGHDYNTGFALSSAVPVTRRWGVVAEGYGYTQLNEQTPGFASTMLGCTYAASSRLVLDSGVDVGVSAGAPRRRVYAGVTYAMGNIYSRMRER